MSEFFFISYSAVDAKDFARQLADELAAGPPPIPVWVGKRTLRPSVKCEFSRTDGMKRPRNFNRPSICGDETQIPAAITAYEAARASTSDPGVVHMVLQRFDALAQADARGILRPVRSAAAGEHRAYEPSST